MRILFLSHYFPPEVNAPANRTFEHARRWVETGHSVTVITGVPNHPRGELFPGYRNRWRQEETREGVHVIRTWMYLTPNEGFLRRTLNYLLFAFTAILASRHAERPDIVVATSPQFFCGLAGAIVARMKGVPFVLEVRDLWPESIVQLGQLRNRLAIRLLEALESALYRRAAGIVVNTTAFADHIEARGIPRNWITLVHNGIDPTRFCPRPKDPALLAREGLTGRFLVSYIGTLGLAHGLATVIEAAEKVQHDSGLVFLLLGDGADRARLEAMVQERGLENVRILGLRPHEEIPAWIASSDVLLVTLRNLPVFRTVIPSKLFEFLAGEKPVILSAPEGECRRMVERARAALCVPAEDPAALLDALGWVREHPAEARALAQRGRQWVEREFRRDRLADRMLAFLEEARRRRR